MLSRKKICIFNLLGFSRCLGTQQLRCKYRRVAQRDRWTVTLYQKHFDLDKTRCATTDYVTWKATVDVCNRIVYVAHDWQTDHFYSTLMCIFLFSEKFGFPRVQNFCCWACERCKHLENANGNENRQCYYYGGVITLSFTVLKDDIFFIRPKSSD